MKKAGKIMFSMALSLYCGTQVMNVHAAQNETKNVHAISDYKSMAKLLSDLYSLDADDFEYIDTKNDVQIYENDDLYVEVAGLNLDQHENQEVRVTYSHKKLQKMVNQMQVQFDPIDISYTVDATVQVKDQEAPVIESQDMYTINRLDAFDLEQHIQVTDDSKEEVKVEIDSNLDTSKAGEYTATIFASDASGNTAEKEVKIIVNSKEDPQFYQKIADAALAQVGVNQDCTMLVTNSLKAVGINFHGAPYKYTALGEWTDTPVPGDICIYQGHVAIYIGNGQAVHGGWMGYTTVVYSVECSNPFLGYIHVTQPA